MAIKKYVSFDPKINRCFHTKRTHGLFYSIYALCSVLEILLWLSVKERGVPKLNKLEWWNLVRTLCLILSCTSSIKVLNIKYGRGDKNKGRSVIIVSTIGKSLLFLGNSPWAYFQSELFFFKKKFLNVGPLPTPRPNGMAIKKKITFFCCFLYLL